MIGLSISLDVGPSWNVAMQASIDSDALWKCMQDREIVAFGGAMAEVFESAPTQDDVQSARTPAVLTTRDHLASSETKNLSNSSGLLPTISTP